MKRKIIYFVSLIFLFVLINSNYKIVKSEQTENRNLERKDNYLNLSYSFNNFSSFLELYHTANETEKPIILADYLSWQESIGGGFPAIQNITYTVFIYYDPLDTVDICGIVGDFTAWNVKNMTILEEGVSFFYFNCSFEPTSRIDYLFVIDDDLILDDRNPRTSPAGFDFIVSELAMPEFIQPEEINYREEIAHGQLQTLTNPWSNPIVQVYLPPYYDSNRLYPVLYTGDGSSYTDLMSMVNILDNLIADERISPIIVVFIDPIDFIPGQPYDYLIRVDWYNCNPEYLDYLEDLVEYIDSTYSTNTSAYARCHLGYSISGLVSTYVALEKPNLFKLVASQSGSFSIGQSSYLIKTKYSLASENLDFKAWFSIGTYENNNNFGTPMVEDTEEMASICESKGWITDLVYNVGECHSNGQWRHCLDEMLEFFFPYKIYIIAEETEMKLLFLIIPSTVLVVFLKRRKY